MKWSKVIWFSQAQAQGGSETVDAFRAAIDYRFTRLQAFYDATNNVMRMYRLDHVELVTEIFNNMMRIFGEDIEYVRHSRRYVDQVMADVLLSLGGAKFRNQILEITIINSYIYK